MAIDLWMINGQSDYVYIKFAEESLRLSAMYADTNIGIS